MLIDHQRSISSHWGTTFPDAKILLFFSALLAFIIFIISLLAIEIFTLAWIEGTSANSISFPFYEFKNIAKMVWSQNPWAITKEWFAQPVLEIGHHDEQSGLSTWKIYYFIPGIISHLVTALLAISYFLKAPTKTCSLNALALMVTATLLLITSSFYLSVAAHCTGANWALDVLIRAWQNSAGGIATFFQQLTINVPALYLIFQWIFTIIGIFIYIILLRKHASPSIDNNLNKEH